ncbi:glycosyltransferase [Pseudomonas sp. NPDC087612]|uniref:glycosyltransferase n=1 Tax=unclassified Pseudomonas TaxID=196821 RepID=UPI0008856A87|nr:MULTISPECIES: glycosyltransferase [unclassified Pseudomonas]UVL58703.1 glycosyltransferase [Pseudomonas sp. B21-035]UVL64027.1 glycosyltransferase [Pseudomonas sp. B21-032]UVM58336.1 glycosyltransferase [Pseudomonas sp. B21-012]SDQ73367.1 Glycosyltransferase involved in cell wall bisynthesis [Pseudomonas sp. UC 17F4]
MKVSVVVPMFNEARHIARTLQSALNAAADAGLDCELVVVDNGSSDDGPQIARSLGAQVLSLPGLTIGALRNRGVQASSGEWLAFLDADIEVPEHWLSLLLKLHGEGRGDVFALDCDTPRQAPWFARAWQRRTLRAGLPALHPMQWLPTPNLLMQRHWFDQVGGFNETLRTGEDKDFTWHLNKAGARLLALREPVVLHWGFEGSWREWLGKELWRQGSNLQLLRSNGPSLRLLRFPLLSLGAWLLDFMALSALLDGYPHLALLLLLVTSLPALALSLRQSLKHRDLLFALQLWGLHWIRLHLAGAAFVLSLFNWNARRPARG